MTPRDHEGVVARYKTLSAARKRAIARQATPTLWAELARAERQRAMDRSPGPWSPYSPAATRESRTWT